MKRNLAAFLAGLLFLAGCTSLQVQMNRPLPMTPEGMPDFASNYGIGNFEPRTIAGAADWAAAQSDLLIFVAFSGGGKRSSSFGHGALRGLRAIPVQPAGSAGWTMLQDVDYLAGVSGGSFPAAHYGLYRERHFETFAEAGRLMGHLGQEMAAQNWRFRFTPALVASLIGPRDAGWDG